MVLAPSTYPLRGMIIRTPAPPENAVGLCEVSMPLSAAEFAVLALRLPGGALQGGQRTARHSSLLALPACHTALYEVQLFQCHVQLLTPCRAVLNLWQNRVEWFPSLLLWTFHPPRDPTQLCDYGASLPG